jgi:transcriptional regulator with XRE-family HTH domain
MTQKELADRVGLDHTTVSRIERGVYVPPRRTFKALTDAIGEAAAEQVAS